MHAGVPVPRAPSVSVCRGPATQLTELKTCNLQVPVESRVVPDALPSVAQPELDDYH